MPHCFKWFALLLFSLTWQLKGAERPNIIWIVGEDLGPQLRCYGDRRAITPNVDRLSAEGARYTHAFTHAPVCAPSRSGLITGKYPTAIGTHHMRSKLLKPPTTFTAHLRQAGYYVAWPGKTDFNFDVPKEAFDSTNDWLRRTPTNRPFFGYVNINVTHESRIRGAPEQFAKDTARLKPEERQAPSRMKLPPYYPDAPEVRRDIANYYELVTALDYRVGEILARLKEVNLSENTIVVFFGDHGWGMPRGKRWVYDSGIRVPLIVKWPGRINPGRVRDDLVTFVDLPVTMLALAGAIPEGLDGRVFLPEGTPPRKYVFAARDRMDETYDRIRCVRDSRFKYIRNYEPGLPYAQHIQYMDQMPTMRIWRDWNAAGKLKGPQQIFFSAGKPPEELYDLEHDPHEIQNLINSGKHRSKLRELRQALDDWLAETHDLGEIPETELIARGVVADKLKEYEPRRR
jgi:N-sulfoglucosamine sulfohydrolase